jgi:hypothetical protein
VDEVVDLLAYYVIHTTPYLNPLPPVPAFFLDCVTLENWADKLS